MIKFCLKVFSFYRVAIDTLTEALCAVWSVLLSSITDPVLQYDRLKMTKILVKHGADPAAIQGLFSIALNKSYPTDWRGREVIRLLINFGLDNSSWLSEYDQEALRLFLEEPENRYCSVTWCFCMELTRCLCSCRKLVRFAREEVWSDDSDSDDSTSQSEHSCLSNFDLD
jgi:hypothetical protein